MRPSTPLSKAIMLGILALLFVGTTAGAATLTPWQSTTSLQMPRFSHGMVATNTHVYVLGGVTGTNCTMLDSVEVAPIQPDGTLGAWQFTTPLSFPRGYVGAAIVGKYVYVVGGANWCGLIEATKYATVERAEILADGMLGPWSPVASLTQGRAHMPVVTDGTHLYAVGGFDGGRTNTVEMATVSSDGSLSAWQLVAGMTTAREAAAAAVVNGQLYVAGGLSGGILSSSEGALIQGDGTLATWQPMAPMSVLRYQATGAGASGIFLVAGGTPNGTVFNSTEQVVLDGNGTITGWLSDASMQSPRVAHGMAVSGSRLYVAGGVSNPGAPPVVEASVEFASISIPNDDLGQCRADLAQAEAEIQTLQGQITDLNNQISVLSQQSQSLQAQVNSLTQQNQSLQTQVATLSQQYQALNTGLQNGLGGVEHAMQQAFNSPQFHIPGTTPLQQLQSLVDAILGVNRGQLQGIYTNLTGK